MATTTSVHARTPANLELKVRDWGTYVSFEVVLGQDSVYFYPRAAEGQTTNDMVNDIVEMMKNIEVTVTEPPVTE